MKLSVRLFAALRERAGADVLVLDDLPDDLDIAGLKREIERRHPGFGSLAHVAGVVGTRYVPDTARVGAQDDVSLLPPVSGGSDRARGAEPAALELGVFELSAQALDPAHCQQRVLDDSCGAVVVFTGTTRATNRGKHVVRLEYEAFEAMTAPEMARIFAACRAELAAASGEPAARMLCQHRSGVVGVGDASVVIAVASPHRDTAFTACRFLIDALKKTLPIWKKEVYADGHTWIGERS